MINVNELQSYKYCKWAVQEDNQKVGIYVKKQCQIFIDIVEDNNNEAYFDMKMHEKVDKLLSIIVHPDLSKPMNVSLEDYQWLIIDAVFSIKNREDDSRYYQTVLLEIARKNFKSFTCGIIIILLMLLEARFSRFFSVAPDLQLSKEVQVAIHKIIESSPALMDERKPRFKYLRDEVRCLLTDSEFKPLACSNDRLDGKIVCPLVQ